MIEAIVGLARVAKDICPGSNWSRVRIEPVNRVVHSGPLIAEIELELVLILRFVLMDLECKAYGRFVRLPAISILFNVFEHFFFRLK